MHRERVVRLLLAGALVMTAPGCGEDPRDETARKAGPTGGWRTPGCEFSRPVPYTTVGTRRMPATPPRLAAVMARIDQGGREWFATSFAGLEVDQTGVRAIVYRVPSAPFDDFIRATAENTCVVVRDAAHGVAELTAWHDRVVTDLSFWAARGVSISSVGSRHDGAGVQIGTPDLDATRGALLARYTDEAPLVFVEEGPIRPLSVS